MEESQSHQAHEGCDTKFNGTDGEYGKSASLWFAAMERCRVEDISPSMFLRHIDRHLEGDAYQWMRNTENVRALICLGYMNLATESDVETFRGALNERFKLTDKEAQEVYEEMPIVRLLRLRQRPSEDLEQYYNRVRLFFLEFHGDDGENGALAPSQKSLRSMVVSRFVSGLSASLKMRLKSQQIYHHSVSLHQAFKMAEAKIKFISTEKEKEKGEEKERERKRKLVTDEKDQDNAKKQKQKIVKLELPTATEDDESSSSSDPSEGSSNSDDDVQLARQAKKGFRLRQAQTDRHSVRMGERKGSRPLRLLKIGGRAGRYLNYPSGSP